MLRLHARLTLSESLKVGLGHLSFLEAPQVTLKVQPRLKTVLEVVGWSEYLLKGLCPLCENTLFLCGVSTAPLTS